jgi:serine/threonine protein kinase
VLVTEIQVNGRAVIEKRLTARELEDPSAMDRLASEARLLAAFGGRGAPRLVEVGRSRKDPWLRMEKVPLPTLSSRIGAPAAWIDASFHAALATLAEIHETRDAQGPLSVVHADLSPANIAIDDTGSRVVFLDFGLATWRDAPPRDGAFRGTVHYVAPEIARGDPPTTRSDLFSLAMSFLHVLTGEPPRKGGSLAALIARAAEEPVVAPASATMAACLAHDPALRPESARALLAKLRGTW